MWMIIRLIEIEKRLIKIFRIGLKISIPLPALDDPIKIGVLTFLESDY